MKKKYQVFISSTYIDLIPERTAVHQAVLDLRQIPAGMELFAASDSDQWEIIKDEIDSSDYYVLIVGARYGSVIESGDDAGISYTEKEFNYARAQGVPILAFIKSDDADYKRTDIETDPERQRKLRDFTEKIKTGRVVKWFETPHDLVGKVTVALHTAMAKDDRPGWVRGNQTNIDEKIDTLIELLEDYRDGEVISEIDWDEPVEEYVFDEYRKPTDGKHKKVNKFGDPISEGEWVDGELKSGIEYGWLILVTQGQLIYKPDCPDDPYDASEDFQYEKYDQYAWKIPFGRGFGLSDAAIEEEGLEQFYVVDMKVDGQYEQMQNIKTLEEFLREKDPKRLEQLRELVEEAKMK